MILHTELLYFPKCRIGQFFLRFFPIFSPGLFVQIVETVNMPEIRRDNLCINRLINLKFKCSPR